LAPEYYLDSEPAGWPVKNLLIEHHSRVVVVRHTLAEHKIAMHLGFVNGQGLTWEQRVLQLRPLTYYVDDMQSHDPGAAAVKLEEPVVLGAQSRLLLDHPKGVVCLRSAHMCCSSKAQHVGRRC
jgi:hypothetical protein